MARFAAGMVVVVVVAGLAACASGAAPAAPVSPVAIETGMPTGRDHVPQLAFDGSAETFFRSGRPVRPDDTFSMVFAEPVRLRRLRVVTGQADGQCALASGVLETSADGKNFAFAAEFASGRAEADLKDASVKAVRIRATAESSSALAIREITLDARPPVPVFRYPILVTLDCSEVPEMQEWCERARKLVEQWYPTIADALASEGYTPPRRIELVFKKGSKGIAGTSRSRIVCYDGWFKAHPDDYGAIIHEATHVVQSYPKYDPVWLVEGITDYVRFWIFEPQTPRRRLDPARIRYEDGYQVTGAFLAWLVERYDKDIVRKLNAACRKSQYTPDLFKQCTGKDLDTLWEEFRRSLSAR